MNTFFVGNHPVGHYVHQFSKPQTPEPAASIQPKAQDPKASTETSQTPSKTTSKQGLAAAQDATLVDGEKIFFMKARILAGQADLSIAQNKTIEDFKWVSKEELETLVAPEYWLRVKNMLVAQ
jgi:large subunit ribosomal protein L46